MRSLIALLLIALPAVASAAPLVTEGDTPVESRGPRAGQYRSFGWQERERMTATTYDAGLYQGDGNSGADAAAAVGAAEAAAAEAASSSTSR